MRYKYIAFWTDTDGDDGHSFHEKLQVAKDRALDPDGMDSNQRFGVAKIIFEGTKETVLKLKPTQ